MEVTAEVAESRWGSGEVRLQEVHLLDASGRPTSHPATGDAVTFHLR